MKIEKRGNYNKIEDLIKDSIINTKHAYKFDVKNSPELIIKALMTGERITIIGDYDCDGISASAIMFKGLNRAKELMMQIKKDEASIPETYKQSLIKIISNEYKISEEDAYTMLKNNKADKSIIRIRLPHRYTEGYGMKDAMVDEIPSGVLITVDNGIAAASAIQKANDKGLITILTDHHSLPVTKSWELVNGELKEQNKYEIPSATCLINPHFEEVFNEEGHYEFYDYCGAGIALKIMESVLPETDDIIDELYAFAAIATVADVMPMIEDNRNIFERGVDAMRNGHITQGLAALIKISKLNPEHLPVNTPSRALFTSDVMGFKLGPMINAPGRVGTSNPASMGGDRGAERSLRCLLESDEQNAEMLANELNEANENRKEISKAMQMKCEMIIADNHMQNDCPLVVHIPDCGDGVIGLVAGYLCEKYHVPAIVFKGEGDVYKGSARSPEGINMKELLDDCQSAILTYGGHPGAAGLTIKAEGLDKLRKMLYNDCEKRGYHSVSIDAVPYDLEIDAKDIPHNVDVLLNTIAPFGEQNKEPVFLVKNFPLKEDLTILGNKHIKIMGDKVTAIGFSLAESNAVMEYFKNHRTVDLLGTLSVNCFRGVAIPQLSIQYVIDGNEIVKDEEPVPQLDEEEKQ